MPSPHRTSSLSPSLDEFFAPRGVAVIGASQTPSKLGYAVARNLIISGYPGALHWVNPHGGELFGRPIYPDVASVPDPVDLAMILIPAAAVPQALKACAERGIRAAIVGSGGFREVGPEGAELERQCLEVVEAHDIRVVGPNCIGLLDTHLPLDTTFLPLPGPIPGDIAFISHSGAICEAVIDWARGQGFGLSRLISIGNQMDLEEADFLAPTAADPETRVLALYIEGVGDGQRFIEEATRVVSDKPVVAIKVGRSERGRAAVASHTGALAGEDVAYDAAFRKAGVLRAESSESLFDWARALAWCPLPAGRNVAVLTNAGGPGAIAVDALDAAGMYLSDLTEETTSALADFLPPAASLRNPVDMLAGAGPAEYADALRALLADPGVDSVMVILPPPPVSTAADIAGAMIPVIRAAVKPVVVTLMGEDLILQAAKLFRQAKIPDYRFPERAASALRVLVDRAEILSVPSTLVPRPAGLRRETAETILDKYTGADNFLPAHLANEMAKAYGLPVPEFAVVSTVEEACKAADHIGYPVALKVIAGKVTHKSDIGGVELGLPDSEAVARAFQRIQSALAEHDAGGAFEACLVQAMAGSGQEVIVGMVQDPNFGPLMMFGSGGVEVEGLKDTAFALAPLAEADLDHLITSTWAGQRLQGYRNIPPADVVSVRECLVRLSHWAVDFPRVKEIEINPLRVFRQGAAALDIRVRLD